MINIAILLATYNGQKYIKELLESFESQSKSDFVCFIHDDGSTDNTIEIIKDFIEDKGNKYIILENPPLHSPKDNFLWMLSNVEANYYMFADQDDVWIKEKIEKSYAKMLELDDSPSCVFADMLVVDENLNRINDSFIRLLDRDPFDYRYQRIIIDNPAAGCTMMINKALRNMAIKLKDTRLIEMHDVFILSLASAFGRINYIDEPLVLYRQHEGNIMGAKKIGVMGKVFSNISDLLNGKINKEKKEFHNQKRNLAKAVISVAEDKNSSTYKMLKDFSEIEKETKINRIRFYKRNGFNRKSNNFWFYLWI